MSEDAIIALETKLAYQDDLLEQLNRVVADQQKQIHELETRIEVTSKKLQDLIELAAEARESDERPPHY